MNAGTGKQQAYRFGHFAETLCAFVLRLKGYRILERRCQTPVGEIDLIARRGKVLIIVEVKARSGMGAIEETLSSRQRRRIERAALAYQGTRPEYASMDLRFDLMTVRPWRAPRHLPNAWIVGD